VRKEEQRRFRISERESDKAYTTTHSSPPFFQRLDEDDDRRNVSVLLRVHGGVVELVGVLDESGEGGVDAEVDEGFGVGFDDCSGASGGSAKHY